MIFIKSSLTLKKALNIIFLFLFSWKYVIIRLTQYPQMLNLYKIEYRGVAQLVARDIWDCEIDNSSKIPYTAKKPLILRFFRFPFLLKCAIIRLRPHVVPQLRIFCKNPSIKLNKSGCGAVGSARHLGCRCRRFEPCHSDQILTEFRGFTSTFGQFFMLFVGFVATFKKIAFFTTT